MHGRGPPLLGGSCNSDIVDVVIPGVMNVAGKPTLTPPFESCVEIIERDDHSSALGSERCAKKIHPGIEQMIRIILEASFLISSVEENFRRLIKSKTKHLVWLPANRETGRHEIFHLVPRE